MRPTQQALLMMMKDSPPNPEDGELWLPSDVFHEIVSSNFINNNPLHHHQNVNVVTPNVNNPMVDYYPDHHNKPKKNISTTTTNSSSLPKPKPKGQILDVYKCGFSGGRTVGYNNNNNNNVQPVARPIHTYNPMFQPTITPTIQVSKGGQGKRVVFGNQNKRGGTGVFLPHRYSQTTLKKSGVSITKNRQSGNDNQENQKDSAIKNNIAVEQDCKIVSVSHLPKDWTY